MKFYKTKRYLIPFYLIPLLFFSLGLTNQPNSQVVIHRGNLYYLAHTVVVKFKSQSTGVLSKVQSLPAQLNLKFGRFKFSSAKQMFRTNPLKTETELDRIVTVKYDSQDDPFYVASKIKGTNNDIEWVEPKYVRRLVFTPNDPGLSLQYYIKNIQAKQAWDISTGDTNVVIGIVDTGVDWPHPDLYANIWHNWKEINNNWAGDPYPYDSIGWDFGGAGDASGNPTPDNNPIEDKPVHGTLVAGTADAVTNNGIGVAGIGYKCKIMAVKVAQANEIDPTTGDPYVLYGFEGIQYAVDNGAKVINCSWGGDGYSNAEQDMINYAIANGALVVAAAGNDASSEQFYPADYAGVLSVAATDQNDNVANYSNYGSGVDLAAPGNGIYSTFQPNTYNSESGTSFASPLAAGVAALVFSRFSNYTPLQVAEQVRVNCDNIDALNPTYAYQIGKGRLDAYNALADSNSESVRAVNMQFSDAPPGGNGNGILEPGETITVGVKFVNYLRPIQNLTVTLVSMNSFATVNNASFSKSSVGTLDSLDNYSSQFSFTLADSIPLDTSVQFRLEYSDGSYLDFQLFNVPVNPSYYTQSGNNVSLTITSKGDLAFNDYPNNTEGNGFQYKNGNNLLFEGALMFGTSANTIEDAARDSVDGNAQDNSFAIVQQFKLQTSQDLSYQHGITVFNDINSPHKLGITTRLDSYTFTSSPDNNYIILSYSFVNNSKVNISNFYAGLYFDWDLVDGNGDSTAWDTQGNLGYTKHTTEPFDTLVATALISSTNYSYWAILNDGSDGYFGVYNGFTPSEKWQALSSGIGKSKAGVGDISEVTSGGPFTIQTGDTLKVAFAVAAGNSLSDLRTAITNARTKYSQILTNSTNKNNTLPVSYNLAQNYPNPFNPSTTINYSLSISGLVTIKVYDILGKEIATLVNEEESMGSHSVQFSANGGHSSGVYFYQIRSGSYIAAKKMVLLK
ncbi:MAG: S8 family serine peptidase [Ignavibacteriaceae bacterium]